MSPTYSEKFFAHEGRVSDKWEQYISTYDREFARFINTSKPVNLLEIGVQNGGSLEIWSELLPPGSTIIGVDIDPRCAELTFQSSAIKVVIADASSPETLENILGDLRFDIILDDGSHRSDHVIASFKACFPRLADGGLYIIEDLHTSYWPEFGGGYRATGSSIEWLKALIDAEHTDYIREPDANTETSIDFLQTMNQFIRRIAFYDSVCVIEKYAYPKHQPHKRILTGTRAAVMDPVLLAGLEGPGLGADLMLTARTLDSTVESLKAERDQLQSSLETEKRRIEGFQYSLEQKDATILDLDRHLANIEEQLRSIKQSTIWRATGPLRRMLAGYPRLTQLGRRTLKAVWWTLTGQLRRRLNDRAAMKASKTARTAPPESERSGSSYDRMKDLILKQREARLRAAEPKPIPVITVPEAQVKDVLKGLSFPKIDAPVVSIIIPVFNNIQLTTECLVSIRDNTQTDISFEVIVSDDASTDLTPDLLPQVEGVVYLRNSQNLHFVKNCNAAAQRAKGEFILFLNNDVQVTQGWLDPLVDAFRHNAHVGAAGPKIIYPSGHLQEAGVMLLANGNSELIGLGDNPDRPRYNFLRGVDYCSGAALLVKKQIFLETGGFWDELAPAYCEDLELCLRLSHQGLRILYVPQSIVVHHLSRTTAASDSNQKMQMIVQNRQKVAERWQVKIDELNKPRVFAFYLPQFHAFPENDLWWGKGFTEWTNVTRAQPMFRGHYQPQLPADLGFYDLRIPGIMAAQADLARRYGIEGFCFYYYWFDGKRLLDAPLEAMLESGDPDFPFMLCWANENWSRRWDGQDHEVLMAQKHSPNDDHAVITDIMRYMRDSRYVRIDGKPILLVYRVDLFPDFVATAKRWRQACLNAGLGEIFLVAVESMQLGADGLNPARYGCDGSVQFPPHGNPVPADMRGRDIVSGFKGQIYDYEASALAFVQKEPTDMPRFPGVMPAWDNTARRMERAAIFDGASPGAFQAWLEEALRQTHEHNAPEHRLVFINAWNEWAEGAQLEPDRLHGHARLEAVRNALLSPYQAE